MAEELTALDLGVNLPDIGEINRAAQALLGYADAEQAAAKAASASARSSERLAKSRENLAQAQEELRKKAEAAGSWMPDDFVPGYRRGGGSNSGSGGGTSSRRPQPREYVGPRARLDNARKAYEEAKASGVEGDKLADLEYRFSLSQKHVDRLNKPDDFAARFNRFFASTRFGDGNGMMPLVGRTADLLPDGLGAKLTAELGPIVAFSVAVVEGTKALYQMSVQAAESGRHFSSTRFETGANNAEAAQLIVMGKATGVDLSSASASLNEKLTSDPIAMAYGAQFGASNIPGPFGKVDQAGNLLKVIDGLRKITNAEERLRAARILGVTDTLALTQVTEKTFRSMRADAELTARIQNEAFQRSSAEFEAQKSRLNQAMENLNIVQSKGYMKFFGQQMDNIADEVNAGLTIQNFIQRKLGEAGSDALGETVRRIVLMPFPGINDALDMQNILGAGAKAFNIGVNSPGDPDVKKTESWVEALNRNTSALSTLTKGITGGGERARGAMPESVGPFGMDRYIELNATRRGLL